MNESRDHAIEDNPGSTETDRRARNKARTRESLSVAAVELFATQGYADTSVEEIADRAGVSPRTFFRYFESKHDVLMPLEPRMTTASRVLEQPAARSDLEALRNAYLSRCAEFEAQRERLVELRRALSSSASLRGRSFDQVRIGESDIARALARRRGEEVDDRLRLVAMIGSVLLRSALESWLDGPPEEGLAPSILHQFDLLEDLF